MPLHVGISSTLVPRDVSLFVRRTPVVAQGSPMLYGAIDGSVEMTTIYGNYNALLSCILLYTFSNDQMISR